MKEFFYAVDLGAVVGPRLEKQAEKACFEDREQFAAILLSHMLELMEAFDQEEDEALATRLKTEEIPEVSEGEEIDDGLPF
ncbi:hypothetical protein ACFMBG_14815 [Leisingera sp. D0M16]|uniref:hypothetical protein n=1 Tax=Leisingera coralii TaxID=3351347 RepID=UPI003B769E52